MDNKNIITIEDVEKAVNGVYLLVDKGIVRIIIGTAVGNRLKISDKPIWLLLLAGSSAGKTSIMDIVTKCGSWIVPIDTLTSNTFASGQKRDVETSLLWKANNGVLIFKDFTTILSMNEEGLREVMGQLRGIYDGSFKKEFGNGVTVDWHGKIGIIAGGTGAAARKMRQYSEQGERFINYVLNVADSKDMAIRAFQNVKGLKEKEEHLRDVVAQFVNQIMTDIDASVLNIPEELQLKMIDLANFATLARSPVTTDFKDNTKVVHVGDREQPSRMAMMLANYATTLMIISREKELSELNQQIIYKIALDSIPADRRMVLRVLAEFREASTKSIALKLHYDSSVVRGWCSQLDALKILDRHKGGRGSGNSDIWSMKQEFKDVMCKYENIKAIDTILDASDDDDEITTSAYIKPGQINDGSLDGLEEQLPQYNFKTDEMQFDDPLDNFKLD